VVDPVTDNRLTSECCPICGCLGGDQVGPDVRDDPTNNPYCVFPLDFKTLSGRTLTKDDFDLWIAEHMGSHMAVYPQ